MEFENKSTEFSRKRDLNGRNRRKLRKVNVSPRYKGVSWYKQERRWGARIKVDRKSKFLGYFDNEIEAARVYDAAAREHHGQFAGLNFPKARESVGASNRAGASCAAGPCVFLRWILSAVAVRLGSFA